MRTGSYSESLENSSGPFSCLRVSFPELQASPYNCSLSRQIKIFPQQFIECPPRVDRQRIVVSIHLDVDTVFHIVLTSILVHNRSLFSKNRCNYYPRYLSNAIDKYLIISKISLEGSVFEYPWIASGWNPQSAALDRWITRHNGVPTLVVRAMRNRKRQLVQAAKDLNQIRL